MSEDSRILDIHQTTDQNSSQTRTVAVIVPRWLERDSVNDIADKLSIKSAPEFGIMDYESAIKIVQSRPNSLIAEDAKVIEGIVARSYPLMLFRDGTPIMWKLKVRDFDAKEAGNMVWRK